MPEQVAGGPVVAGNPLPHQGGWKGLRIPLS